MSMFCYQCQETARGTGCDVRGVCGKSEEVAKLQDLLLYTIKGMADAMIKGNAPVPELKEANRQILNSLFTTITNANFDDASIEAQINAMIVMRDGIIKAYPANNLHDAATFTVDSKQSMLEKAAQIGVLSTTDPDIRSLRQTILNGLKGISAYAEHALHLHQEDPAIYQFMAETLSKLLDDNLGVAELLALALATGTAGVSSMALLDKANTTAYGNPEITTVNIGVRKNPAILISGHDLIDLQQLLEQTKGTGVDVYTHSEMLPAHYYPAFKKYDNFAGNYGNAWWKQVGEFETFHGPVLFTSNCIVPPRSEEVKSRIFTTNSTGYPGCVHIVADENGHKDFSQIIELAKTLPAPQEIETGTIVGGFAHNQVLKLADKIVDAVKSGAIKRFFVMAGCDGRMRSREYYSEFAQKLPKDTVILTAGCAKYRYNKLDLGDIGGIPRVLDAGQCNDSYSLVLIANALKDAFGLSSINELPITFNIAWYEQKAVLVLLALLSLGITNIHLGPTLPGFASENVLKVLVEQFGMAGIGTADEDVAMFMS